MEGFHSSTDAVKYQFSPTSPFGGDNFRSGISRSLYAAPSESSYATSVPFGTGFGHQYLEPSPPPSGLSVSGDANNLASRVAMLSCSYNSNSGSQAGQMHDGVPAVPPIPAHFLGQDSLGQSPFLSSFPNQAPESFTRGDRHRGSEDVKMEYGDNDDDARSRARSDEYDVNDGFFGRMEE
ncbi:putative c2h2 finger domain [Diaporthe ampelina]|uniref:Putative c2h2 finger domain n=1 Tax=Diaporthe ampelina TaxID=1214573 RepID=A0A0G2HLP9_9PEZI|nr:putative c2h2 finger domain [Diaporthe ampelina]